MSLCELCCHQSQQGEWEGRDRVALEGGGQQAGQHSITHSTAQGDQAAGPIQHCTVGFTTPHSPGGCSVCWDIDVPQQHLHHFCS